MKQLLRLLLLPLLFALALVLLHPTVTRSAPGCDPSYPDFCIAPPPPDLDCPAIQRQNFKVLPPDPHRFDRDQDGIGCESKK